MLAVSEHSHVFRQFRYRYQKRKTFVAKRRYAQKACAVQVRISLTTFLPADEPVQQSILDSFPHLMLFVTGSGYDDQYCSVQLVI